jgi:glutaredoxin
VREFLSENDVEFEDRNIRRSDEARAELAARTDSLVVPQLFWGDRHIVGFDPDALELLRTAYHGRRATPQPPGNSLESSQAAVVADPGDSLGEGLHALLERIRAEIDFNDAKGEGPYRLGMHDALRFADDAIVELLRSHGHPLEQRPRDADA